MLTLDHAAATLARTQTLDGLRALTRALGFRDTPIPLPETLRDHLAGTTHTLDTIRVLLGEGLLAACIATTTPTAELRTVVRTLATQLGRHAPHHRWLLCIASPVDDRTTIATWSGAPPTLQIAALSVDRTQVRPSDADTLRLLAAALDDDPHTTHQRWLDTLRRDALGDRFYRAIATTLEDLASSAAPPTGNARVPAQTRRELALLTTSRLLFLAFLEAKGWLDHDRQFLRKQLEQALDDGGRLHQRLLAPLCFGTLNTPIRQRAPRARAFGAVPFLNGGLFARTPLERQHPLRFADPPIATLIADILGGFRFTARESATDWHDAAIDPAMLGRTFESLMATEERRRFGTFFTPPALVDETLDRALQHVTTAAELGPHGVQTLTVLDPACGSGAFLVRALERLADHLATLGDRRPVHLRRREVLMRSIFGIDRHPLAVWLCELRLWLSVVIDHPTTQIHDIPPLPNLDHHLHVGDALTGGDFTHASPGGASLATLRLRYTRATGARKRTLARTIDRAERLHARAAVDRALNTLAHERREHLDTLRTRDLFGQRPTPRLADTRARRDRRVRIRELRTLRQALAQGSALPFRADAHFADIAARGGFDLVVGNPPWVRPHHVDRATRALLRREFTVARHLVDPDTPAPRGFGLQVDLAACFTERALRLLRPGGAMAFLLPAKLWRSLAGGPLRALLHTHAIVREIHDLADGPALFHAATYPSLLVAQRPEATAAPDGVTDASTVTVSVARRTTRPHFVIRRGTLHLDPRVTAPWLLAPPAVRRALDTLRDAGTPLATLTGAPRLGVKCGVNAAFLVRPIAQLGDRVRITDGTRDAWIEAHLLRPVVRGEDLARHRTTREVALIYPHDATGAPLRPLPPLAARWFAPLRDRLAARTDAAHARHWDTLFRVEGARTDRPRIAWADIGRQLAARHLPIGTRDVPMNSCYVVMPHSDEQARVLLALLSAPIASCVLALVAEPARGGYRRFFGHTVAQLPIPSPAALATHHHRLLALALALDNSTPPSAPLGELLDAAYADALGVHAATLDTLRRWHATP
ncbi:MAG: N-6 DNA methylase [Gemmatimonadaceae bacterium]|nr:N-6 DNA methylase [Gemmatimonadaceae bacterium]